MARLILLDDHLSLHAAIREYLQRIAGHEFVSELTRGSELVSAANWHRPEPHHPAVFTTQSSPAHCRPAHPSAHWKDSGAIRNAKQRSYRTDEVFGQRSHLSLLGKVLPAHRAFGGQISRLPQAHSFDNATLL